MHDYLIRFQRSDGTIDTVIIYWADNAIEATDLFLRSRSKENPPKILSVRELE